jgi:uncharacterized protein with ACT and thioredoxin-like domain
VIKFGQGGGSPVSQITGGTVSRHCVDDSRAERDLANYVVHVVGHEEVAPASEGHGSIVKIKISQGGGASIPGVTRRGGPGHGGNDTRYG